MPQFRRGSSAIEEAAAPKGGGGNFTGFCPEIFWKEDGEKKYLLVLTPIDETISLQLHSFIPIEATKANGETYTKYEEFISRKDPGIGEDYDKIEDELGRDAKTRILGVAVELEPVMETVKGRKRPVGFTVLTKDYTRNTDDGEETVEYPVLGIINQSSQLMWGPLNSQDAEQGPLEDLPLAVTRHIPGGKKASTYYDFVPFPEVSVDLTPIVEHLDGLSYLTDQLEELLPELESIGDDDLKIAQAVARCLLDKRIAELADSERYDEIMGEIDELPAPPWGGGDSKKKAAPKKARPSRPTQRKAVATEDSDEDADEAPAEEETKRGRFDALKASIDK